MRSRRGQQEHDEAVARRLAQLSAELAATRGEEEPAPLAPAAGGDWWDGHTHVAAPRPALSVVPAVPAEVPVPHEPDRASAPVTGPPSALPVVSPVVPLPGRHAARRRRDLLAGALPETLRGRVLLGPGPVAVVAVLVALGLAATAWWVVRGDAEPTSPEAPVVATAPPGELVALPEQGVTTPAMGAGGATGAATTVTVDVAGKVRRPGIAVLDAGARVVDALAAAGGARPGVDLSSLNLARVLVDGEQVLVGRPPVTVPGAAAAVPGVPPAPGGGSGPLVDLNTATQPQLESLPEVGPVTALAILAWRDEHGGFSSVDELLEVDGIGDATLEQIAPFVTI